MSLHLIVCKAALVTRTLNEEPVDGILSVMPRRDLAFIDGFPVPTIPHEIIEVDDIGCGAGLSDEALARYLDDHPDEVAPGQAIVEDILDVGQRWLAAARDRDLTLLVHCQGGLSRSPAAALLILALEDGPGQEEQSWQRLCRILQDPHPMPNANIVRIGDQALDRNGRLLSVFERERDRNGDWDLGYGR